MGNEYSGHRTRTGSTNDGSLSHRFMNNLHPLRFHPVHGENVVISRTGTVACRTEGFCKGIAFSNRPVLVNECIWIKFIEISTSWSGALRIGFTANDPTTYRNKLPRYACPCMTDLPGNWARALAERFAKKDSVLHYYVDQNGDVHYGLDNEDRGIFFSGIDTSNKLWAMLDIYGNTTAIEFLDPRSVSSRHEEQEVTPRNQLLQDEQNESELLHLNRVTLNPIGFHSTHGKNINLSNNRCIATRKNCSDSHGYGFTERPLNVKERVVIRVLKTESASSEYLIFGVTSCNPSSITPDDLPYDCEDLLDRPEYWVIRRTSEACSVGDFVMFFINDEGALQISKNANPFSTDIFVDHTLPLWFFVNLCGSVCEIQLAGSSDSHDNVNNHNVDHLNDSKLSVSLPSLYNSIQNSDRPLNQSECVICCEKTVDCVLYRCGHMCMCYSCATQIWKPGSDAQCPLCRKEIQDIIRTFT